MIVDTFRQRLVAILKAAKLPIEHCRHTGEASLLDCFFKAVWPIAALRDAHAFLTPPNESLIADDVRVICRERQDTSCWGLRLSEAEMQDPPTLIRPSDSDAWSVDCQHLSTFLISVTGWQAINTFDVILSGDDVSADSASRILSCLQPVQYSIEDHDYHSQVYCGDGLVLSHFPKRNAFIAGVESEHAVPKWEARWQFTDFDIC